MTQTTRSEYALNLDLSEYQAAALRMLLETEVVRAEREGRAGPWPTAIREVRDQVDEYLTATKAARAIVDTLTKGS